MAVSLSKCLVEYITHYLKYVFNWGLVFKRTQEKRAIALKRRSNDGGTAVSRQFFSFSAKVDNFEPFEAKLFFLIQIYTKAFFGKQFKTV